MADFSVVRQRLEINPARARVFLLLANGWHMCPTKLSDLGVSPPDRTLSTVTIVNVVVVVVNTHQIYEVYKPLICDNYNS